MKIKCFIFSWKGQYENALKLEKQLSPHVDTIIINSDDDNKPDHWVNIGNHCYFSDQFRKALSLFDNKEYDFFWHVQADASYDDWESILKSAKESYEKYHWGVYAPNVNDTFYISERTDMFDLEDNLRVVADTDNTCWIVHKDIISDMNSELILMETNQLGWGWDLLICAFSHLRRRYVIRDYNYEIKHPAGTGYKKDQAEIEMAEMFQKCNDILKSVIYDMKMEHKALNALYNREEPKQDSIFVYDTNAGI